jgi:hypothetical protein
MKVFPGIEKFFDILEEVKKEEQTTIETLLALKKDECIYTFVWKKD